MDGLVSFSEKSRCLVSFCRTALILNPSSAFPAVRPIVAYLLTKEEGIVSFRRVLSILSMQE